MIHMDMPSEQDHVGRFSVEVKLVNNRDRIGGELGAIAPEEVRQTTLQGSWIRERRDSCCRNKRSRSWA